MSRSSGALDALRRARGGHAGVTRCIYFGSPGGCLNAACTFSHDAYCDESGAVGSFFLMPLCNFFLMGTCTKGRRCRYAHPRCSEHIDVPLFVVNHDSFAARIWSLRKAHKSVDIRSAPVQPQQRVAGTWTRPGVAEMEETASRSGGPAIYAEVAAALRVSSFSQPPPVELHSLVVSSDDRGAVAAAVRDVRARLCEVRSVEDLAPLQGEEREYQRRAQRRAMLASPLCVAFEIPENCVRRLIGKGGDAIARLELSTSTVIVIRDKVDVACAAPKRRKGKGKKKKKSRQQTQTVKIAGTSEAMRAAKEAIALQVSWF